MPKDRLSLLGSTRCLESKRQHPFGHAAAAGMDVDADMGLVQLHAIEDGLQRLRRVGKSVAERIRRALEDQRNAGGAVLDILQRLPVGALWIDIVGALDDQPWRVGFPAWDCLSGRRALVDRFDAQPIVRVRNQLLLEIATGQRLVGKLPPPGAIARLRSPSPRVRTGGSSSSLEQPIRDAKRREGAQGQIAVWPARSKNYGMRSQRRIAIVPPPVAHYSNAKSMPQESREHGRTGDHFHRRQPQAGR